MITIKQAVRYALATAGAAAAVQSASALDISTYASGNPTNIYLSGSTAVDNTILNAALETAAPGGVCQPNTTDVYFIGTTGSYTNRLIFCSASASSGLTAGSALAIFKESVVGSQNGVTPLYTAANGGGQTLTFIDPTLITDAGLRGRGRRRGRGERQSERVYRALVLSGGRRDHQCHPDHRLLRCRGGARSHSEWRASSTPG